MCLVVLLLIFILKRFRQPYMLAYILSGIILGPHVSGIFSDVSQITSLGEIGILLMMFFIGMEMQIPDRRSLMIKPVLAQGMKMILCGGLALIAGMILGWPVFHILLLATLLVFNSTAIVCEYLIKNGELQTSFGRFVLNILLLQDMLVAPLLTLFQFAGDEKVSAVKLIIAISASILIILLLKKIRSKKKLWAIPIKNIENDHELQVFLGGVLCLGFGILAEVVGLSGAMGSFIAGILIGRTPSFDWLESSLKPFKVFFTSLFFVCIGLRIDLSFVASNSTLVLWGTLLLLMSNSLLSAIAFRSLHYTWKQSIYGGALLSQIGEFGIIICSLAYSTHIISETLFKASISITALSMIFSTIWISASMKFFRATAK